MTYKVSGLSVGVCAAPKWVVDVKIPGDNDVVGYTWDLKYLCWLSSIVSVNRVYFNIPFVGMQDNSTLMEIMESVWMIILIVLR